MLKLFAVTLGGRAPGCNTELHDVVFVTGETIEATYPQLLAQWFGAKEGLHLDSWITLTEVDGHEITLSNTPPASGPKLFFINLGGYADGQFCEMHTNIFLVAGTAKDAKTRAKSLLANALPGHLHTDDLHEVDDCLEIHPNGVHLLLEKTSATPPLQPVNGYHIIPESIIRDYLAAHP